MSGDSAGSDGSDEGSDLQQILSAIKAARTAALAGEHAFLVYLLDMAWLEATSLARKDNR